MSNTGEFPGRAEGLLKGNYQGKRPIGFYRWDLDCLIDVIEIASNDPDEYPDKDRLEYKALSDLHDRLKNEYQRNFEQ